MKIIGSFSLSLLCMIFILHLISRTASFSISQTTENEFLECLMNDNRFQANSSTSTSPDIIYSNDSSYFYIFDSTAQNKRSSTSPSFHKPVLIITPHNEFQIQAAVHCSRTSGIQIRVRSGGHDYEGLSYISRDSNPFVVLDMRNIQSISVNTEGRTAWVQAGATIGQLYYEIAKKNRILGFTAGACPTVGIGGHLSGGGYSMMSRKHGLGIDNIVDAKIIDADGRILDRESMGEDLFWAVRGGGGTSFGIIVAFKVELLVVPETLTVFQVSRTLEKNATQLVHKWQYIAHEIDDRLGIRLSLRSVRDGARRTIEASFTSLFLGPVDDLLEIMTEGFPELGLERRDCSEMSWIESMVFWAGFPIESPELLLNRVPQMRGYFKGKSDFVTEPIPERALREIWRFLDEEDENLAHLQLSPLGGILSTIPESETPFPHRAGNMFMIHYIVFWIEERNRTDSERDVDWIQKLYDYMAPYVSKSPRGAYLNYRDLDLGINSNVEGKTNYEQASVWGLKYFKNNFNRLVQVKTKFDPDNFFRNEQSIPPLSLSLKKFQGPVVQLV